MTRLGSIALAAGFMLLWTHAATAQDAVKIGGFWIDNVAVQGVVEGQLIYLAPGGGEVNQPIDRVEGLRLGRYPAMAQAMTAIEANNHADAVRHLGAVRSAAREPWLQRLSSRLLMEAADRGGKAEPAVDAFIALATTPNIEEFYLANPPLASVEAADNAAKVSIKQKLATAQPRFPRQGAIADAAKALSDLVRDAGVQPAPGTTPATAPGTPVGPGPAANGTAPPAGRSAVVLPSYIEDDAITRHLRAGRFAEAAEAAAQALLISGDLSMKLYQHGLAKIGQADAATDDDAAQRLYKDAGLSLMRVVIHFPASRYKGPALVEAGYVHQKIGREDIARRLYQNADLALGDPEEEPAYFERLQLLNASLVGDGAEPAE
jgi:tetratricopeptide (TPR) repeat protein